MRIGLVSDTHVPQRCQKLPPALFGALTGADLILHAGDIGELAVLDELGAVAPAGGVFGNDDSDEARHTLPYQLVLSAAGRRMLLWHGHFEDRAEEAASRAGDAFEPKLARIAAQARAAGAQIAVFGHWHIPLVRRMDGVLLVNPGAVASGNEVTRQLRQTVAIMTVADGADPHVTHIDLAAPDQAYDPQIDWESGFRATLERFSASILAPDLAERLILVRQRLTGHEIELLRGLILPLAHRCWQGELPAINLELARNALDADASLPADARRRFSQLFS